MPKLLDFIKEKGLTHDEVIVHIENLLKVKEPDEEEESEDETEEEEENEEDSEDEEDTEIKEDKEDKTFTLKDVEKLISEAIKGTKKAKRKAPSKGKLGKGTPTKRVYTREEQFEEMF